MAKKSSASVSLEKIRGNKIPEKIMMDRAADLQTLLQENLKCMYWVENHLLVALPKMISAAGTPELQQAFQEHLSVTETHVGRLEQVFDVLGLVPLAKKSDALEGLAMDGEHLIEETIAGSEARNAGLIMAGQLVENYEITAYTGLINLAKKLGQSAIDDILSQTLTEEQEAATRLEQLA